MDGPDVEPIVLIIDKRFKFIGETGKRAIAVEEAFGIGLDEQSDFVVYDKFELRIRPGDIVYITGPSGSGKSILLFAIANKLKWLKGFGGVITNLNVRVDENKILIDQVGKDLNEALMILNSVGLSEAYLYLRKYRELSEGQKYRFKLARMIDSGLRTWLMDEFCSTLDRITAKVVAYCIQKVARRFKSTLIVSTAHEDLIYDLNPTILIKKGFGSDVDVRYIDAKPRPCSLLKDVIIEHGDFEDYKKLERFHYRGQVHVKLPLVFRMTLNGELIGVIVYGPPYLYLSKRREALPHLHLWRLLKEDRKKYAKEVNRLFIRIWRVIVDPRFRGIGLGTKLVKETMPLVGKPFVESLAVMGRYNPFFEKAGMKRYKAEYSKEIKQALERLRRYFDTSLITNEKYTKAVMKRLSEGDLEEIRKAALKLVSPKFRSSKLLYKRVRDGMDVNSIAELLREKPLKADYFLWVNPNVEFLKPEIVEKELERTLPILQRIARDLKVEELLEDASSILEDAIALGVLGRRRSVEKVAASLYLAGRLKGRCIFLGEFESIGISKNGVARYYNQMVRRLNLRPPPIDIGRCARRLVDRLGLPRDVTLDLLKVLPILGVIYRPSGKNPAGIVAALISLSCRRRGIRVESRLAKYLGVSVGTIRKRMEEIGKWFDGLVA